MRSRVLSFLAVHAIKKKVFLWYIENAIMTANIIAIWC